MNDDMYKKEMREGVAETCTYIGKLAFHTVKSLIVCSITGGKPNTAATAYAAKDAEKNWEKAKEHFKKASNYKKSDTP